MVQYAVVTGVVVDHVDGPAQRAIGAGLGFLEADQRIDDGRLAAAPVAEGAELVAAVANEPGEAGDETRHTHLFA